MTTETTDTHPALATLTDTLGTGAAGSHRSAQLVLGRLATTAIETDSSEQVARQLLAQHQTPEAALAYINAAQIGTSQILASWALAVRTGTSHHKA